MSEEKTVKSPCISICVLNESDVCEGCYRSADEITQWSEMSNDQKQQTLSKAGKRFKESNRHLLL